MPLTSTRDLVAEAERAGRGVVAFNVIGLEHIEAVIAGASAIGAAVILQVSANAIAFRGALEPLAAACRAAAERADVGVALHLDHAPDLELCRRAADAGFGSVMFDAAAEAYDENVRATARVTEWAHDVGVWVEAELGEIAGKPGARAGDLTDPDEADAYVRATDVDGLAVAVGSRHKMHDASARLDLVRIAALRAALPIPLVLHGSSGVPDAHLREAVRAGVTKINIGTRLGDAYLKATRAALGTPTAIADPRDILGAARASMTHEVASLLRTLQAAPAPA